jgi:adenosylcobinamide-GDP ribazoletransferase
MSKMNAIKTFRDLLSFLTIIPLAKTEDFVFTSARSMWLFPAIGALIGLFGAGYFLGSEFIVSYLVMSINFLVHIPADLLLKVVPAATTIAFLLVLTGFQHFDGLVDLGNAIGVKKIEDRREIAHRWVVTYKGAVLAILVEFSAFAGLFLLNGSIVFRALIVAEVSAKLAMVTIVWRGKAAHQGLGARFIGSAKRKLNIVAFAISFLISYALVGFLGILVVSVSVLFGLFMEIVSKKVFGGVSGDMIGATNEATRTLVLLFMAIFLIVGFPIGLTGALIA